LEKKVLITVDSVLGAPSGETDKISFVTEGTLLKENDDYIISYEESEITGLEGTTTTIKISKESVTLIRHGNVDSVMLFEAGKTHLTDYGTQFGSMVLGVTTKNIHIDINDSGGNIKVDYILEFNRAYGGRNKLNVVVSLKKCFDEHTIEQ